MSDNIKHVTDTGYQQEVIDAALPTVVDFWAPWCGPCRSLAPVIEELADAYVGKMSFAKMNTDENPNTPQRLGIRGIPTLIVYANGEEVDRLVGFSPKPVLKKRLDAILEGLAE